MISSKQAEHFWARVESGHPDACWEWRGLRLRDGYGQVKFSGKRYVAHRLAYALSSGTVPESRLEVLHEPIVCHNRACCNPRHLRLGTAKDNAADRSKDGTHVYQLRPGYKPNTKLDATAVRLIKFLRKLGNTQQAVADWFGVARPTISLAERGITWPAS